jgi:O-antigen/teichoic acid export membrane protein
VLDPGNRARRVGVSRPLRNVLSNWGAFLVSAVAGFFLTPFVVQSLGNAAYGAWVLLGALVGYMGLLDLGVRGAVTRYVAQLHAKSDHAEARRYASTGLAILRVSAAVVVVGGLGLAALIERVFEIPPGLIGQARVAVFLSSLTIAVALINGVYGGIVTALQRFDLSSGAEIAIEVLRVLAVVLVLRAGQGLPALALVQLCCGLGRFAFFYVLSRRLYPAMRVSGRDWTRGHVRQIVGYSLASTALQGAVMVTVQLGAVVIGAFLPVSMIAFYAIAATLMNYGTAVIAGISHTVPPRVSAQQAMGDMDGARRTALVASKLATLVHLPIIITFLLRGETFIGLWMGPEFAVPSGHVLWILSLGYWLMAGRQVLGTTMMGLNRHRLFIPFAWAEAGLIVGLSVVWVQTYGINGVAWATAVSYIVFSATVYPLLFGRTLQVGVGRIWRDVWLVPNLALIPFGLASFAIESFWSPSSVWMFFMQVALVLPVAFAGAWWFAVPKAERISLRNALPRKFRGRQAADLVGRGASASPEKA